VLPVEPVLVRGLVLAMALEVRVRALVWEVVPVGAGAA
jgi:hypothetical protein